MVSCSQQPTVLNRKPILVGTNHICPCYKSTGIKCSLVQICSSYLCTCIVLFVVEGM